ncbi:uncharacterized protein PRCAT00006356001 [Priceomyces carsonii]|uniref:uncharacterized protein n=1 Tax=Priceomyces carsonii TaxID=28549 RepID=UPI002ED878E8|nr:unnamed protein product [Priceomyces carsonii]
MTADQSSQESTNKPKAKSRKQTSHASKRRGKLNRNRRFENEKSSRDKPKEIKNDYKYLEVVKLVKSIQPVTINGVRTDAILEQAQKSLQSSKQHDPTEPFPSSSKNRKRSTNVSLISSSLEDFFVRHPSSPLYLSFVIENLDPDFPYDLPFLQITLCIPTTYPYKNEKPHIVVLNDDIPRGFAANVEKGFERIANIALGAEDEDIKLVNGRGLLSQIQTLNRYLEFFLKQKSRPTVTFVKPKSKRQVQYNETLGSKQTHLKNGKSVSSKVIFNLLPSTTEIGYRQRLINEVIDRKISLKLFKKNSHQSVYKLQLPIRSNDSSIPEIWRMRQTIDVFLTIPIDYPKNECKLSIPESFSKNILFRSDSDLNLSTLKETELSVSTNFLNYEFGSDNLLHRLNFFINNFWAFCLTQNQFHTWKSNMKYLTSS